MSAFMVDDAHVDVLIDIAKQYKLRYRYGWSWQHEGYHTLGAGEPTDRTTTELGRILLAENAKSVGHRYREAQDPSALLYVYRPTHRTFTADEALQAIRCYEYQSCEHDEWEQSEAFAFCEALRSLIERVEFPGSGPWGWSDADLDREAVAK